MKPTVEEIIQIVGTIEPDIVMSWLDIDPELFLKDGEPYGLVGVVRDERGAVVASTVTDPSHPFTLGMLRYILRLGKKETIVCITDVPAYHKLIMGALSGHGFEFVIEDDILYSIKEK